MQLVEKGVDYVLIPNAVNYEAPRAKSITSAPGTRRCPL